MATVPKFRIDVDIHNLLMNSNPTAPKPPAPKGIENGAKCATTSNVPLITFTNNSRWKAQGEWSNNAYNSGTGYPNSSGQKGCLDGH